MGSKFEMVRQGSTGIARAPYQKVARAKPAEEGLENAPFLHRAVEYAKETGDVIRLCSMTGSTSAREIIKTLVSGSVEEIMDMVREGFGPGISNKQIAAIIRFEIGHLLFNPSRKMWLWKVCAGSDIYAGSSTQFNVPKILETKARAIESMPDKAEHTYRFVVALEKAGHCKPPVPKSFAEEGGMLVALKFDGYREQGEATRILDSMRELICEEDTLRVLRKIHTVQILYRVFVRIRNQKSLEDAMESPDELEEMIRDTVRPSEVPRALVPVEPNDLIFQSAPSLAKGPRPNNRAPVVKETPRAKKKFADRKKPAAGKEDNPATVQPDKGDRLVAEKPVQEMHKPAAIKPTTGPAQTISGPARIESAPAPRVRGEPRPAQYTHVRSGVMPLVDRHSQHSKCEKGQPATQSPADDTTARVSFEKGMGALQEFLEKPGRMRAYGGEDGIFDAKRIMGNALNRFYGDNEMQEIVLRIAREAINLDDLRDRLNAL